MAIDAQTLQSLKDVYGLDFVEREGETREDMIARIEKAIDEMTPDKRFEAMTAMRTTLTLSLIQDDMQAKQVNKPLGIYVGPIR